MKEITEIQKELIHSTATLADHIRLYFYKKRSKNGEPYFECAVTNINNLDSAYSEVINSICKNIDEKELFDYVPDMSKNMLGFFDLTNSENIIEEGITKFSNAIVSASAFDDAIRYDGYVIESLKNGNFIRLLFSSKSIRTYCRRFSLFNNEFSQIDKPIFEIKPIADCIWTNEYCIFLTSSAEGIFDLEKHYKLIAQKALKLIEDSNILASDTIDFFKKYALIGKRPQKFETFSKTRLDKFIALSAEEKNDLLTPISLFISDNKISISSERDASNFLDFICCKILGDFTGEKYVVSGSQKINHSPSQH